MDDDLQEYREKLGADRLSKLATALSDLPRLAPGGEEVRGVGARPGRPSTLMPYADDARLIDGALEHELASLGPGWKERKPFRVIASSRRGFSEWLRRQGKASIASRVNGNQEQTQGLKDDFRAYKVAYGYSPNLRLNDLRKYQQVVEANAAWGMQPPQQSGQSPV
ncbi:hypothetical protein NKH00_35205, partial [Mesorhizobium sp. M1405]